LVAPLPCPPLTLPPFEGLRPGPFLKFTRVTPFPFVEAKPPFPSKDRFFFFPFSFRDSRSLFPLCCYQLPLFSRISISLYGRLPLRLPPPHYANMPRSLFLKHWLRIFFFRHSICGRCSFFPSPGFLFFARTGKPAVFSGHCRSCFFLLSGVLLSILSEHVFFSFVGPPDTSFIYAPNGPEVPAMSVNLRFFVSFRCMISPPEGGRWKGNFSFFFPARRPLGVFFSTPPPRRPLVPAILRFADGCVPGFFPKGGWVPLFFRSSSTRAPLPPLPFPPCAQNITRTAPFIVCPISRGAEPYFPAEEAVLSSTVSLPFFHEVFSFFFRGIVRNCPFFPPCAIELDFPFFFFLPTRRKSAPPSAHRRHLSLFKAPDSAPFFFSECCPPGGRPSRLGGLRLFFLGIEGPFLLSM